MKQVLKALFPSFRPAAAAATTRSAPRELSAVERQQVGGGNSPDAAPKTGW